MNRRGAAVIAATVLAAVIAVVAAYALGFFEQPYRAHLRGLLTGTGLAAVPAVRDDLAYYELHTAGEQLAGFLFLGSAEGWGGPINLFVKTDAAGVIQRVHVWQHTETPAHVRGLEAFLATFAGHEAWAQLAWQEDVHGITGATVTAEAIIAAVGGPGGEAQQRGIFIRPAR